MRCEHCGNERRPVRRAQLAERDGRTAIVLAVPVEECAACGELWLTIEVAKHLDVLFDQLLDTGEDVSRIHWDQSHAA